MPQLQIPKDLTSRLPQGSWGKVLGSTPVVMTVVATCLAGLATSEMSRAQYDRSWAAQLQAKASDEWSYFQAKKLRGITQGNTRDILEGSLPAGGETGSDLEESIRRELGSRPDDTGKAKKWDEATRLLESAEGRRGSAALAAARFSTGGTGEWNDPDVGRAVAAMAAGRPEAEVQILADKVPSGTLDASQAWAVKRLQDFDRDVKPASQWADGMEKTMRAAGDRPSPELKLMRLHYDSLRYEAESRLDQNVGYVYELQVRRANFTADRHRSRSQRFFVGMLGAQMAVVIATFALAAQQKSLLWSFAALAGVAAILFAVYVYLFV